MSQTPRNCHSLSEAPSQIADVEALVRRLTSWISTTCDCSGLEIVTQSKWGSVQESHRHQIRMAIRTHLQNRVPEQELSGILDLSNRPVFSQSSLSISHCPCLGGFAWSPHPGHIGIDLEQEERLNERLVARVSEPHELGSAPHPGALWCAKEAAFKAISNSAMSTGESASAIRLLSQIRVDSWVGPSVEFDSDLRLWTYRISRQNGHPFPGKGATFRIQTQLISLWGGLFVLNAST